jgi:uncharacterized protein (DUF302 family)
MLPVHAGRNKQMTTRNLIWAALAVASMLSATPALAQAERVEIRSAHDAATTVSKLKAAVQARNFAIVAEVDHAGAADKVGIKLRPTTLLVFGNPRGGSPIMVCNQKAGLDLPLRALVRQAEDGAVFVDYVAPAAMAQTHGVADCAKAQIAGATKALEEAVSEATR